MAGHSSKLRENRMIRFQAARFVIGAAVALCAQVVLAAPHVRYHVVALDPGHPADELAVNAGINCKGLVAGGVGYGSSGQATLYRHGKSTKALGTLGGGWSNAWDLNEDGVVVGDSADATGQSRAFAWHNGVMTNLGVLSTQGAPVSVARAINAKGQVAGSSTVGVGNLHAVIFQDGSIVDLGVPAGALMSEGHGINDRGHVVGYAEDDTSRLFAFVWRHGVMTALDSLGADVTFADAEAINADDVIAGSSNVNSWGPTHAVVWRHGRIEDLGTLQDVFGAYSRALALNDQGVVVGVASWVDRVASELAFVYDGRQMFDLNTLLDAESSGWVLTAALAINAKGEITGMGVHDGVLQRFLAVPVK
jgi:probable HAF family extracellular repeat protein